MKFAVIATGGKQYVVSENDELIVDRLSEEPESLIELDKLAEGDDEQETLAIGEPLLPSKVKVQIVEHIKGDKLRVARFKAKTRYRKVRGFRAALSKIKVVAL